MAIEVKRIYCDSAILIYFFDHSGSYQQRAEARLTALAIGGDRLVVSDLVRLEYRIHPLRNRDQAKIDEFDQYCLQPHVERAPITPAVFDLAAEIRAERRFSLADSIHLAAAVGARCDSFLTNDNRLATYSGLPIEILA